MVHTVEGSMILEAPARFGIVAARFNHFIVDALEAGCLDALRRHGVKDDAITIARVPGAFELPLVVQKMATSDKFDAVIALGAVIRGSTPHFDHVASACSRGLSAVAADAGLPVVFGVLTVDSIEQAIERAGTKAGNKGAEAALTAIEMISLLRSL